jgi:flagellar hook-associated protein 2
VAGVTIGGLSSGLPPNLVDQLIDAERQPIKALEVKKEKEDTRLKLVTDLETKLNAVQGTIGNLASQKGFSDIKLESGDPNIIQGAVDASQAPKGDWNVEVMELAQKAAAVTNGFPDKDKTQMGVGYFSFDTPQGKKEVYINGAHSTLEGAATAINNANVGMKASVINDRKDPENPYRLMISGVDVGGDNQIEYPTLYFLDGDQDIYFDQTNAAKNGRVKIDGFEFEIADNTVKDLIPGVTLNLKQASPGRTVNVNVKENREVVNTKVGDFVKTMNEVLAFIQQQNAINEKTDTSKTLGGDSLLRSIENRLRRLIQDPQYGVGGSVNRLNQLGIEFQRNGTIKISEDKFNSMMASNPDEVRKFFAGDGFNVGFVPSLRREISNLTNQAFGQIANRKRSLQDNIKRIDENIASKEKNLEKRQESLRNKFAHLEETMSRLKQQGAAVAGMAAQYQGPSLGGAQVG